MRAPGKVELGWLGVTQTRNGGLGRNVRAGLSWGRIRAGLVWGKVRAGLVWGKVRRGGRNLMSRNMMDTINDKKTDTDEKDLD